MKVVITGSSGFIGFHASKKFLDEGFEVIGIDNENCVILAETSSHRILKQIKDTSLTRNLKIHY